MKGQVKSNISVWCEEGRAGRPGGKMSPVCRVGGRAHVDILGGGGAYRWRQGNCHQGHRRGIHKVFSVLLRPRGRLTCMIRQGDWVRS